MHAATVEKAPASATPGRITRMGQGMENGELVRLSVTCPKCGTRPALRLERHVLGVLAAHPDGQRLATYQCQRRGCGTVYDVPSEAFRVAR